MWGRTEARGEGDLDPRRKSASLLFRPILPGGGFSPRALWNEADLLGVRVPVPRRAAGRRVAGVSGESSESARPSLSIMNSTAGSGAAADVSAIAEAVGSILAPLSCLLSNS